MPQDPKVKLYLQLAKARRRYNLFCLERAIIHILVVALALALTAILIKKFLGGPLYFYLLFLLPFFGYLAFALTGLYSQWLGIARAAYFIDKQLNLKAGLITALEYASDPNPSRYSTALTANILKWLDDEHIKRTLPHRPPKSLWILIPLAIALPLVLLLKADFPGKSPFIAYKESQPQRLFTPLEFQEKGPGKPDTKEAKKTLQPEKKEGLDKRLDKKDTRASFKEKERSSEQREKEKEAKKEIDKSLNSIASLLAKLMPPMPQPPSSGMQGSGSGDSGKTGGQEQGESSSEQTRGKSGDQGGKPSEATSTQAGSSSQQGGAEGQASDKDTSGARPSGRQASPDSNLQEGLQILEHRDKISQVEAAQAEGTLPREIVVVKSRSPGLPPLQQAPLVLQVVVRTERQASPGSIPRRRLLILGHKNRIKAVWRVQAKKILPRGKLPKEKAVARSRNLALPQNLPGVGNTFPCPLLPFLPPIRKEQGVKIQANSLLEREGRLIKGHNKGKPKKKN
ncbi:MAG TPA: hypothetical protein ACFYD1_00630 [Candidatus Hypogeohydataceae bacterium YC38]